jgi:hypothetical protein
MGCCLSALKSKNHIGTPGTDADNVHKESSTQLLPHDAGLPSREPVPLSTRCGDNSRTSLSGHFAEEDFPTTLLEWLFPLASDGSSSWPVDPSPTVSYGFPSPTVPSNTFRLNSSAPPPTQAGEFNSSSTSSVNPDPTENQTHSALLAQYSCFHLAKDSTTFSALPRALYASCRTSESLALSLQSHNSSLPTPPEASNLLLPQAADATEGPINSCAYQENGTSETRAQCYSGRLDNLLESIFGDQPDNDDTLDSREWEEKWDDFISHNIKPSLSEVKECVYLDFDVVKSKLTCRQKFNK